MDQLSAARNWLNKTQFAQNWRFVLNIYHFALLINLNSDKNSQKKPNI